MNKEIKDAVVAAFESNKNTELLHVTSDAQCFENWHDANEHSKTIGSTENDRNIVEVKRSEVIVTEVKKTIPEQIEECETIEAVEALIKPNWSKTNKDLAAAKIESLKGE